MPGYDEAGGFIVAAVSEDQARALLSAPQDTDDDFSHGIHAGDEGTVVWADPTCSNCEKISEGSIYEEPKVVIRDFHHG